MKRLLENRIGASPLAITSPNIPADRFTRLTVDVSTSKSMTGASATKLIRPTYPKKSTVLVSSSFPSILLMATV